MKYLLLTLILSYSLPSFSCKQSPKAWSASLKTSIQTFIDKSLRSKYKSYEHSTTVSNPKKNLLQDNRALVLLKHKTNKENPCVALEISNSTKDEKSCSHEASLLNTVYVPRLVCDSYIK